MCAFNQEKALVGAFSVIVKPSRTFVSSSIQTRLRRDTRHGVGGGRATLKQKWHHKYQRSALPLVFIA